MTNHQPIPNGIENTKCLNMFKINFFNFLQMLPDKLFKYFVLTLQPFFSNDVAI